MEMELYMKILSKVLGSVSTNCYIIKNEKTNEAVIIDPASDEQEIREMMMEHDCKPVAILLTHGHFDHILAADDLRKRFQIPVIANKMEDQVLQDRNTNLSTWYNLDIVLKADQFVDDLECLDLAGFKIQAIHTPGHTIGSSCYYFPEEKELFSGDTLFTESVGRTDFPTGSSSAIVHSVKEKLMLLPDETQVHPGHGPSTTIRNEKQFNPYCQ